MSKMGSSASGKSCACEFKDKGSWIIIGYAGRMKDGCTIKCLKCNYQWDTKAKYIKDLKKASYLN